MRSQHACPRLGLGWQAVCRRFKALSAGIASTLIALRSVARGLPLFLSAKPGTPLRVLCIMAFDTLHVLRHAKPLPKPRVRLLAALLDFAACVNAAFDNKTWRPQEYREGLQALEEAGIRSSVVEYLRRLRDLESRRPLPGGDDRQFHQVGLYREAVVRLSLGMVAATADGSPCLDAGILATYGDAPLNVLFRIVMQCQIIDDVLDYSRDMDAGLPSFLTASPSPARAYELTRLASLGYADDRDVSRTVAVFPLRSSLFLVSTCARLAIALGRWSQRARAGRPFAGHVHEPRLLAVGGVDKSPS